MDVTEFFSTTLPGFAALLFSHEVTPQAFFVSLLLSIGGTGLILNHVGFKTWLDPLPYFFTLLVGSCLAHGMLGSLPLPGMAPLVQIMVTSLLGMTAATLILMGYAKPEVR